MKLQEFESVCSVEGKNIAKADKMRRDALASIQDVLDDATLLRMVAKDTKEVAFAQFLQDITFADLAAEDVAKTVYLNGWDNGQGSEAFMRGIEKMLADEGTYLHANSGWLSNAYDVYDFDDIEVPIYVVDLYRFDGEKDLDKLQRTADLVEQVYLTERKLCDNVYISVYANVEEDAFPDISFTGDRWAVKSSGISYHAGSLFAALKLITEM